MVMLILVMLLWLEKFSNLNPKMRIVDLAEGIEKSVLIKADDRGMLRVPDFPEADRPFNDWAAKIIGKEKSH